ncbi:hypothetical protein GCM10027082_09910 [Comamonas humi]
MTYRRPLPSRSRGATLVVALIFLVLMSLFAVTAFNSSSSNMRVIGNTQARQESAAAAKMAVEETISSSAFHTNPAGVAASPVPVDMDGDGTPDYSATISPQPFCFRAIPTILPAAPKDDPSKDPYKSCRGSDNPDPTYVDGSVAGADPAGCVDSEWSVRAVVADAATRTTVAENQGVAVTIFGYQVADYCK